MTGIEGDWRGRERPEDTHPIYHFILCGSTTIRQKSVEKILRIIPNRPGINTVES
jgi:hypothetical protein